MKLYDFLASPNPLKVRIALSELGLDHENKQVALFKGEQRSADFLGVNPCGKVPVLEDGGIRVRESNAILTYLGRKCGGEFWPETPIGEAHAMQWLFFESVHLANFCGTLWFREVLGSTRGNTSESELAAAAEEVTWSLNVLEQHLENRQYMLGDKFSIVDCSLGVAMAMVKGSRVDDGSKWPNATSYRERVIGRDSWLQAKGAAIYAD